LAVVAGYEYDGAALPPVAPLYEAAGLVVAGYVLDVLG
jgi:hypothetical protein